MPDEDSEALNQDLLDHARDCIEKDFTEWCDQLAALPPDFEPELRPGIIAHIELQPLRWINSGLDLLQRRKESSIDTYLSYPLFQMGAEIFLKGMWLCQFEECRLLGADSYIDESRRKHFGNKLKDTFGHDLLKITAELRQIPLYRDGPATMRFLAIVEAVIRTFYYPFYLGDKLDYKWAHCRYPKRFYSDVAKMGSANAWNRYPQQRLVAELFQRMKRDINDLWDF